ncbi:hypothetical protein V5K36_001137, partial [Campylobacter upsaliensis]
GYPNAKASKFQFSLKDDIDKSLPEIVYSGALTPQITDLEKIFDKKFIDFKYQSNITPFLTNKGGGGVILAKSFTSIRKIYKQIKPLTR